GAGKGFHFIPEIGEEVLVGFENGNAEKSFVLDTHYNGSETSGYHSLNNDQKIIHTRSGTKIILNDAQGCVFIEDPSGNRYEQENININTPKNAFSYYTFLKQCHIRCFKIDFY
ncbi:phage baseplate assembly protein V, partial [Flavobacterium oreochromis]|uniref:phage baseplate assembly protein V n=1 Tax=Flavobacterium oreochromis TaxID=2906078 RepID=UPI00385A2E58